MLNPYQGPSYGERTSSEFLHLKWSPRQSWNLARVSLIKGKASAGRDPTSTKFPGLYLGPILRHLHFLPLFKLSSCLLSLDSLIWEGGSPLNLFLFYSFSNSFLLFLPEVCSSIHWMKNTSLIHLLTNWMMFFQRFLCMCYLLLGICCPFLCSVKLWIFAQTGYQDLRSMWHSSHCFVLQLWSAIKFLISKWMCLSRSFCSFPKLSPSLSSLSKIVRLICLEWWELTGFGTHS